MPGRYPHSRKYKMPKKTTETKVEVARKIPTPYPISEEESRSYPHTIKLKMPGRYPHRRKYKMPKKTTQTKEEVARKILTLDPISEEESIRK
jgi:hypothetical protein